MRSKYKRFVFLTVLLFFGIIVALVGGSYAITSAYDETMANIQEKQDNLPVENESKFIIISEEEIENGADLYILVDKETRVEYLLVAFSYYPNRIDSGTGTSITPIYNADGSLKIYEGELK